MCVVHVTPGMFRHTDFSKKMVTWHMPILQKNGHLAEGAALPTN